MPLLIHLYRRLAAPWDRRLAAPWDRRLAAAPWRVVALSMLLLALGCGSGSSGPGASPSPTASPAGSPVAVSSPGASPAASPAPGASPEVPPPVLQESTITSRGENPWRLDAAEIEYDDENKTARVGKLTWSLLDKAGQVLVRVEGNGARVDVENEKVAFEGPVVAYGPRGEVMNVRDLRWNGKERKFYGSEGVRVVREGTVLTGKNLVASPDLRRLQVEGDVKVRLTQDPTSKELPW